MASCCNFTTLYCTHTPHPAPIEHRMCVFSLLSSLFVMHPVCELRLERATMSLMSVTLSAFRYDICFLFANNGSTSLVSHCYHPATQQRSSEQKIISTFMYIILWVDVRYDIWVYSMAWLMRRLFFWRVPLCGFETMDQSSCRGSTFTRSVFIADMFMWPRRLQKLKPEFRGKYQTPLAVCILVFPYVTHTS